MIYHFVILSSESEDFIREILIDSESTFEQFHEAIQDSVDYDTSQLASFFVSDEEWQKGQEITLMPMDFAGQGDQLLMRETRLEDYIKEKKDKLIYVFDYFGNRGFFIELGNIGENRKLAIAKCVNSQGLPPEQIMMDDLGMEEFSDLLEDPDKKDAMDFADGEFDDMRYDDLSDEDYSELF